MSAATTTGVTVKWAIRSEDDFRSLEPSFRVVVTDTQKARILFRIVGFRPTEIEARSACCDVLTKLNVSMGIPLADMVEVSV